MTPDPTTSSPPGEPASSAPSTTPAAPGDLAPPDPAVITPPPPPEAPDAPPPVDEVLAENERLRAELSEQRLTAMLGDAAKAARLVDPTDVLRYVDRAELLDSDGMPSEDKIFAAASRLAAQRPYLRGAVAMPSVDGGTRQFLDGQLGQGDLAYMTAEEIERAHRAGRFNRLLGINQP